MLEDIQSQAMYRALKAAGGLHSPAGDKATAARSGVDDAISQIDAISQSVETKSIDPLTQLPVVIPTEVTAAVAVLSGYKVDLAASGGVLDTLSAAISTRMSDPAGNMAIMNVASKISQNMNEVDGGCGPVGEAFSVLTSVGNTDALSELLGLLPLGAIQDLINSILDNGITNALRDQLAALMAEIAAMMVAIGGKSGLIGAMVAAANAMWSDLYSTFKQAVETSVLMSVLKNPCMQAIAESVMPDSARDVMDTYLNG